MTETAAEAAAREALSYALAYSRRVRDPLAALDAYRDAIIARHDAEVRALVDALAYWSGQGGHAHWCDDPCDCGRSALLAVMAPFLERERAE